MLPNNVCFWRITRDTLNTGEEDIAQRKGVTGPFMCDASLPTPIEFRMVSDDWPEDQGAYYGVAANEDSVVYALDGFGIPDAGFTAVHIMEEGEWVLFIG